MDTRTLRSGLSVSLVAALGVIAMFAASLGTPTPTTELPLEPATTYTVQPSTTSTAPFSIDPNRWLIAHRGGDARYPEEGYRGYYASSGSHFALELDVRQTKDGKWVLLHDQTVDRTMRGVTGDVRNITLAQWMNAYLRPDPAGRYRYDRPATLGGFLNRYGDGRNIIVLEHKGGDRAALARYVKAWGPATVRTTMMQDFDFDSARYFASQGLASMLLMGDTWTVPLADIRAAGIRYVGVARTMGPWHVAELKRQGFIVVSYTVNSLYQLGYETTQGVDGVFSDDPWALLG